jgi:hypothetical protein
MKDKKIICDVLVVGAGLSGLAAAAAACEKGARTVLLEQNNYLGGAVITGMHRYLCGFYRSGESTAMNPGITREFILALRKLSARNRRILFGKMHVFAFRSKDLNTWMRALVKNKKNLKVILKSRVYAVTKKNGSIREVQAINKGGRLKILPRAVIDASGQGAVIKLSRAKYRSTPSGKRQLAGFSFRVRGVKDVLGLLPIKVPYYIKFATYAQMDEQGEGIVRLNIPSGGNIHGVKNKARKAFHYLRQVLPEFKNASIAEIALSIVEREGICLQGEYTLTASDVLQGRKFSDGVVKNAWPMELWDRKKGPQYSYLKPGRYYEIPLRCLRSKHIKNLLATGRCISATHEALASTRAAGTCLCLGEQAGIAAVKLCESF